MNQGLSFGGSVTLDEGGDAMVTYEGLFAFGMLIVAVIALCVTMFRKRK